MKPIAQQSTPAPIDDQSLSSNYNRVVSEESLRGLDNASMRLNQTRTDVFNKLRELGSELDRRKGTQASAGKTQSQVAQTLITQFTNSLTETVASGQSDEWILAETQRLFASFQRKLAKVLEFVSSLEGEDYVDAEVSNE